MSPRLVALALLGLAVSAYAAVPLLPRSEWKVPAKQRRCPELPADSTEGVDVLLKARPDGTLFSDFKHGVEKYKLGGVLRRLCKGKALVAPSNQALSSRFVKLGLYNKRVPKSAVQAFKQLVLTGVCVQGSTIPKEFGCSGLYISRQLGLNHDRLKMIPTGDQVRAAAAVAPSYDFSILGTGYNSYTGFPLSYGMSSLDPGMTLAPVFDLIPDNVRSLTTTGGSCTSQFSTSVYNSVSDMKQNIGASLNIQGNLSGISFKASASFNMLSQTTMTSNTVTTSSGAKIYLGGWGLAGGPGALSLDPGFIKSVQPLVNAAAKKIYDPFALQALIDNYGTHYIRTVFYGGLASVVTQMTSQGYSSLKSMNIKVNIAAQAQMIQGDIGVDYSESNSNKVESMSQTFTQILIPSSVQLSMATNDGPGGTPSPSFIDCVAWTNSLRTASEDMGWKAPVHYTLAPITGIFSFSNLFPEDMRPSLPRVQAQLYRYMTTCGYTATDFEQWAKFADTPGYTACPDPPAAANCVTGTYRTRSGGCNSCYGDGTVIGPNCNVTTTLTCTAFACYCMPKYENDPVGNKCLPLAPAGPTPPAPSLVELSDRKKK